MRTVFTGGRVFDGTGAPVAEADVAIEDGVIAEVGAGLDGDEQVDVSGSTLLPGLFDTHVHVMYGHIDMWRLLQTPFSYRFYDAIRNLDATIRVGITTVRDAGGADLGVKRAVEDGIVRGPRLQISLTMLSQTAWDTSAILSDTSLFGRVLRTLIGYSDQPSVLQVVVYLATLAVIVVLTKTVGSRRAPGVKAHRAAAG